MSADGGPIDEGMLGAIAESATLSGLLEAASEQARAELAADPEWNTPKHHHVHRLVEAFAVGVISADPWHRSYKLPPDFEGVVNWIAFCVQREYGDELVPQLSLLDFEAKLWDWGRQHPSFMAWNETDKLVGVVHRYSETPAARDFIDLDALVRNAAIYLRNETRRDEAFDANRIELPRVLAPVEGEL